MLPRHVSPCLSLCFTLGILFTAPVSAEEVYKSRNERGIVEFSDKAPSTADKVKVRETATYEAVPIRPAAPSPTGTNVQPDAQPVDYRLAIVTPADGAIIRSNAGNLSLRFSISPPLRKGHRLRLLQNGEPVGPINPSGANLTEVDRGENTYQLQVVEQTGKKERVVSSGPTTQITLLRHSVLQRKPAS